MALLLPSGAKWDAGYETKTSLLDNVGDTLLTLVCRFQMGNLPEWNVGGKKLTGKKLNFYIAFIASNGFLMFGYDQGVLSALITLQSWQEVFPLMTPRETPNDLCWIDGDRSNPDPNQCTGDANLQAFAIAIYQIGCFLGAVVILFYGEKWGRKPSTFWGSLIMIIGKFFA